MTNVILRDGRVLRYNLVDRASVGNGILTLSDTKDYWIVKFNIDVVERVESDKPCRIMRERRDKKILSKY